MTTYTLSTDTYQIRATPEIPSAVAWYNGEEITFQDYTAIRPTVCEKQRLADLLVIVYAKLLVLTDKPEELAFMCQLNNYEKEDFPGLQMVDPFYIPEVQGQMELF